VRDGQQLILDRDAELAAVASAAAAAAAGRGRLVLVDGPAGIGKSAVLRAARAEAAAAGMRLLPARGLYLEQGFSYGIVRQLLEPARAACGPGEWNALLDGEARLAGRVLEGAEPGAAPFSTVHPGVADGVPHATLHALYWLVANLAGRQPLALVVDDAHWADGPSLVWLSHLAARIDNLPLLLLLGARSGPDQPDVLSELRGYPASSRLELRPLGREASSALVRDALGDHAGQQLGRAAYAATKGNPFLLEALLQALRAEDGSVPDEAAVLSLGPQPVADAVVRRIGRLGADAVALARAIAVLGRPAPLRYAAALTGMDLTEAALLADQLRAASVVAGGSLLEFEHPIVRTAIYESIPPGGRAIAHAGAAELLEADGTETELIALHLVRSEPAADPHTVAVLRAAAAAASERGAPGAAAGYLRRALAEPPPGAVRGELLLDLGLALARDRDQSAVTVLHEAVAQVGAVGQTGHAKAALLSSGALGIWGYHESAAEIALDGLAVPGTDPLVTERLEAELFANSWISVAAARSAWDRIRSRLAVRAGEPPKNHNRDGSAAGSVDEPGFTDWCVYDALAATIAARDSSEAMDRLGPALAGEGAGIKRDSLAAVMTMLVLVWNDELEQARAVSDVVLADAGTRGSLSLTANVRCLRSLILRRLGRLQEAAADGRAGFDFRLKTSPPLAVAWSAAFLVEALTALGQLAEADDVVTAVQDRRPPDGWIHSISFAQARGALRVAQRRYPEGLADLRGAAEGWQALGVSSPAGAYWRVPAVIACAALDRPQEAARLAAEQLELARAVGTPVTQGVSLRAAAPFAPDPERALAEAISLLEQADGQYEQGLALADLGAYRRRAGRRAAAREPLRRALDYAERTGAEQLRGYARAELLAVGARPRRAALTGPEALTAAQSQVAALAARGQSNRQIAQQLFITQATVETHLRHAFHKLGITSRADLPARLASSGTPD
jgi:DNA-binding CsgD family transcriptional regulator